MGPWLTVGEKYSHPSTDDIVQHDLGNTVVTGCGRGGVVRGHYIIVGYCTSCNFYSHSYLSVWA